MSLTLSNAQHYECDFSVYLSNDWNSTYYREVRITSTDYGDSTNSVSSYVEGRTAPSTGTSNYCNGVVDNGMSPGNSYTLYAYALPANNDTWWLAGSDTITMQDPDQPYNISSSVNGLDITISFSKGDGAYRTYIDKYWVSGVYDDSTTGTSFSFSVPSYNTTYTYDMISEASNGNTGSWTSKYYFTTGDPPPPPSPTISTVTDKEGSIYVDWNDISESTFYQVFWKPHGTSTWSGTSLSEGHSSSYTIAELNYGYKYDIYVEACNGAGCSASSSTTGVSLPKQPTLTISDVGTNHISVTVSGLTGNYHTAYINIFNDGNSTYFLDKSVTSNNTTVTFTGLTSGATYQINGRTWATVDGVEEQSNYTSKISVTCSDVPADWSWSSYVASGRQLTYTDSTKTKVYTIPATEWVDFINWIKQVRNYYQDTTGATLTSRSFTTSMSRGTTFYNSYFDEARYGIRDFVYDYYGYTPSGYPSTKSKGDKLKASDFDNMVYYANSVKNSI